ncbi:MAG: hypothetical protein JW806_04145 [Sedimentisphaerales bacterium]|nr:hypothetical protein [Sedimentisphaerales bacterium]
MEEKLLSYINAINEMPKVGNELINILLQQKVNESKDILILVFAKKATRLIEALCLLIEEDYIQEAQILARTLLETKFAFDYVVQNKKNYDEVFQNFIDSLMLDKLKQIKVTNYEICPDKDVKESYLKTEEDIKSRYSTENLKQLRRFGFTGRSIRDLADSTGNMRLYNLAYRFYSRNIHVADANESLTQFLETKQDSEEYNESQFKMICEVICVAGQSVLQEINKWCGSPIDFKPL